MEIHQSAVILLLVVCVSFSTHAHQQPPPHIRARYEKFLNQHRDPDMSEQKCDSEMRMRDITGTGNGCKPVNTFIQANTDNIKAVCGRGGTPQGGNLFKSNQPFPVITCRLRSGERPPNCEYRRGKKSTRYVVLGCEQGWPVHYEEGIVDHSMHEL